MACPLADLAEYGGIINVFINQSLSDDAILIDDGPLGKLVCNSYALFKLRVVFGEKLNVLNQLMIPKSTILKEEVVYGT